MSFNDKGQNSVSSLLDLLKKVPESFADYDQPPNTQSSQYHAAYNPQQPYASSSASTSSVNPTQRQLDELLASLRQNSSFQAGISKSTSTSASDRRKDLISPFGPVGTRTKSFDHTSLEPVSDAPDRRVEHASDVSGVREKGWESMSFTKALPVISSLLEDESFKGELKRMKAEQDALERRLWAKQEKLKADLDKPHQAEKEVARISRKPIPPAKQAEWDRESAEALKTFYSSTVLPSLDGIAEKHRLRLEELGVPGLGGGQGPERVKRLKMIMGVLQAAMEE